MTDPARVPESEIPGKPTSASRTTLSHIMTHNDTNLLGTVHGGVIMKLVDDAAGAVAGRHSEGPAVTASMDEMAFLMPVRVGDLLHVRAQVNWTGRSSMEVGVRVVAERWNDSTPAQQVGTAYLVFTAVDADGKPRQVPPVIPETERDKRRYQEAQIRRTHRLARRRAILDLREQRAAEGLDADD
ncbi:acyl-CoA thioesterase [Streptomyces sp. CHA1]|jgi:acyl-CoA hydrolase|uniref:Acyl-CoA thioesterase n=4 Tax=Streptomyces TaxID=1883 RepID=A0ACC7XXW2_9ACTN|nr:MULTISPECIES: acyl-CoA thioesterase [Streptomyces]MYQ74962.1 acyl-CoA thioesterase [Streptomyces sp. SID4934]MYW57794.1 acyl-CoA thioesterase [Streptomyces sp. SID8370]MYW85280.1 acyl-CoA thioesterase [Streptomyces sp. SID8371]MYX47830.1 acyl-CoA thioesterase [Streptomyces sp. SID8385]MYX85537.1 acyl-CoA thioesterase [Streptomyces sp. SID4915]NUV33176.1 acyl-CoA thioesterase [Streptomyces sp. KAI-27]NUV48409.1 acyl-CoA thioesterase [Streptomyces sp. CAI-78]NUW08630.1 acyl-CoA thioesteras